MKKRGQARKNDNVILFPDVEKRLAEKGLESLHNKKYSQAISYLEEAKELDPNNDDVLVGLVLAYFEAAAYQKAKDLAKEMLLKGAGDYFQLVELYLSILVQLHEYQEIVMTIEALLDEKEIHPEKYNHFFTILQFSRRMADNTQPELHTIKSEEEDSPKNLHLLSQKNLDEQMLTVSKLAERNIHPFVGEIEAYLKADTGHPFLKTMLLTLLKEQEINRLFIVKKFNFEREVIPIELPEVRLQPKMIEIKDLLGNHLEHINPALYENMIGFIERIFFISYPFELEPESVAAWAAAFELLGQEYFGFGPDIAEISEEYGVFPKEVEQAAEQIERIEKISYPNI